MPQPFTAEQIFSFIRDDFARAWNLLSNDSSLQLGSMWQALGYQDGEAGLGTYSFSLMALIALEIASEACDGAARTRFADELNQLDANYFTRLPEVHQYQQRGHGPGCRHAVLPYFAHQESELLHCLHHWVRHGQAHEYQQKRVALGCGGHLRVSIDGPHKDREVRFGGRPARRRQHLYHYTAQDGDLCIVFCPDIFLADLVFATHQAQVFPGVVGALTNQQRQGSTLQQYLTALQNHPTGTANRR